MKKALALLAAVAALLSFAAFADDPLQKSGAAKIYNEDADARADVDAALKSAKAANKNVLVVFGANWCGDCRMLDTEMHQGTLAKLVNDKLVVVKVDVNRFNKNVELADQYGTNLKKGIPTVAMLKPDGSVLYATNGGELADARGMGRDGVTRFFTAMLDKSKK